MLRHRFSNERGGGGGIGKYSQRIRMKILEDEFDV